jgi:protein-S-isoprenylcysteine O-methyltransferase Ste14
MYAAFILFFGDLPLVLQSVWGLAPLPFFIATIALRALDEEKTLAKGLPGYEAYLKKVRWRLIPCVW